MLKVRLMGTKNDITWFGKILKNNPKIEVTEFSDLYGIYGGRCAGSGWNFPKKENKMYCYCAYILV